jgi:hypothetical protein
MFAVVLMKVKAANTVVVCWETWGVRWRNSWKGFLSEERKCLCFLGLFVFIVVAMKREAPYLGCPLI